MATIESPLFALLLQLDQKIAELGVAQGLDCLENKAARDFRAFVRVQGRDDATMPCASDFSVAPPEVCAILALSLSDSDL